MLTGYQLQSWLRQDIQATPLSNELGGLLREFESELVAGQSEDLKWLGNVPPMRERKGEMVFETPAEVDFAIKNLPWYAGIELPGAWWRNDREDLVRGKTRDLGVRYQQLRSKIAASLLIDGESTVCFDGEYFFDTDHTWGNQSNDLSFDAASATAPTPDEAAQAIHNVITAMLGFEDEQGEPVNEGMSEVVVAVGTPLGSYFQRAISAEFLATGTGVRDNVLDASGVNVRLIISPRLKTWTTKFAVVRADAPQGAPAMIFQENKREHLMQILDESSDHYVKNDQILAKVQTVGNGGYGMWTSAALCTLT